MTEIIAFGLSWQSRYSSGSRGKQARGYSEHRESCPSDQNQLIGPPQLLIPGLPQLSLGWELVWGPPGTYSPDCLESPTPGAYTSEGSPFSSLVLCRQGPEPEAAQMPEGNPAWDAPPFHSNNKSSPLHLGFSAHFSSGCFRADLTAIVGASVFWMPLWFFVSAYLPPHILYRNIPSEPIATVFLKDWFSPNTCFCNLRQISGADWVRNLSFKIISSSVISGSMSLNTWRASSSLF